MGGKTAMVTALNHPEVIERLVVVDVSPHRAPGGRESSDLITALRNLDITSLSNRREADAILGKDVKVCCVGSLCLSSSALNLFEAKSNCISSFPDFQTFMGSTGGHGIYNCMILM